MWNFSSKTLPIQELLVPVQMPCATRILAITGEDWEVFLYLKEHDLLIAFCPCQATSNGSHVTKSWPSLWSQELRDNWSILSVAGLYQIWAVMFYSLVLFRATLNGLLFSHPHFSSEMLIMLINSMNIHLREHISLEGFLSKLPMGCQ